MKALTVTVSVITMVLGVLSCSNGTSVPDPELQAQQAEKQFMNLEYRPKPNGYTHVVSSPPGRMIFLSGQGGSSSEGEMPEDFASQAENTFKNIDSCLKMAGATFNDVVKINYYLRDMADLTKLRKIRANYLNMDTPPAATAVQTGLGGDLLLEVEVVAIVPE